MKNNPDAYDVAEESNSDADISSDSSKTNEEDDKMNILEKE